MAERSAPAGYIQHTASARADRWWIGPIITAVVYAAFLLYGLVRVFENQYPGEDPYLAPFYSLQATIPGISLPPVLYFAWMPLAFRATCYYYRKSYYRAFLWDPPACAVREPRRNYRGETTFPFVLNNLHRFALYLAVVVWAFLVYDAIHSLNWHGSFGIGVGSVILWVNAVSIALYTFSCHSWRHLVGGSVDCFSCTRAGNTRHATWSLFSRLNKHHGTWAWVSLFTVWGADLYIRMIDAWNISDRLF